MKFSKLRALYSVIWQEVLVYRGAILLWTLILTLPFFLMYFVWTNIYSSTDSIAGFNLSEIVTYYFLVMIVMRLVETHLEWSINWQVREGLFTIFLVQPISPIVYFFMRMLSFKIVMAVLSLPLFFLIFLFFSDAILLPKNGYILYFFLSLLLSSTIYLFVSFIFGFLAFWLEDAEGYLYMKDIFVAFLAGAAIPLDFIGGTIGIILKSLPFVYMISFPLNLYLGKIPQEEILGKFIIGIGWAFVLYLLFLFVYKKGIKRYSAVGN